MGESGEIDKTISRQAAAHMRQTATRARLRVVYPRDLDWSLELSGAKAVLGRQAHGEVEPLEHGTVSRSHLRIEWNAGIRRHVAVELGSRNGSTLRGAALEPGTPAALEDNDVLGLGDLLFVYERASASDEPGEVSRNELPGDAARMRTVRALLARAAPDPSPILLVGETGTGKEWAAREAHRLSGRSGPLVPVNCAALSPQLIESQLFGHVRGAFTGATTDREGLFRAASKGSLFLDEIGELPAELQPKLLRVLQEREIQPVGSATTRPVDVRILAATNRNLAEEVRCGRFRRDLYARIALWEIELPPLRRRRVDILMWLDRLFRAWSSERGLGDTPAPKLSPEAAARILSHPWAENLRGIDRLVHALGVRTARDPLGLHELPAWLLEATAPAPAATTAAAPPAPRRPSPGREELERALEQHDGNIAAVARHFDRDRRQIYRWLESFGIANQRPGEAD